MKKIIALALTLVFVLAAFASLTMTASAADVLDLYTPANDGDIVFTANFHGIPGEWEPGNFKGTPEVTPSADGSSMTMITTTNKTASYWGGFVETLPLNETTCYTIYFTATRSGKHSVGFHVDTVYGVYGYPERMKLLNKGSSLSGHDYVYYDKMAMDVPTYDPITGMVTHEYAVEINGVNTTIALYIKDNSGKYILIDQSVEGTIDFFMADTLGIFFYSYYAGHAVTISDCYVVKGLSWGEVVYPETTVAPETEAPVATEAPATEAPATEAPATEAPATEAPADTEAPVATNAPETTKAPEAAKSGCGSVISASALLVVAALAAPIVIRKKRD